MTSEYPLIRYRPHPSQVAEDNPHFECPAVIVERTHARKCDRWAHHRGYSRVVTVRASYSEVRLPDGRLFASGPAEAVYGWHNETACWHLWAN